MIAKEILLNESAIYEVGHPEIPWNDINTMRNILVHEYFRTDAETVWNVIQLDLSDLKGYALNILNLSK